MQTVFGAKFCKDIWLPVYGLMSHIYMHAEHNSFEGINIIQTLEVEMLAPHHSSDFMQFSPLRPCVLLNIKLDLAVRGQKSNQQSF